MEDIIKVEFEMEQKMCGNCKKSSSEYYQLKTQIRFIGFNAKEIEELKHKIKDDFINHFDTINKYEETTNGFDLFFRYHGEMNKITSFLYKKYFCDEKRTKKIMGHDPLASKDLFRYTQRINIVNLKPKMEIFYKGERYLIKAINKSDLVLLDTQTGQKKVLSYNIVKDYLKF